MAESGNIVDLSLETFSKIVESIYDCALDPNHWHDTISMIAELCESPRCALGVHDFAADCNKLASHFGYEDEECWRLHESKYKHQNPFYAPIQLVPVGAVATQDMLVDDAEFLSSKYYRDWCEPQGLRDLILVKVLQTGQRVGLLIANRVISQPRYGEAEVRLLTLLSPHVCRAVAISDVLNLQAIRTEGLEATLDALTTGVYLVDRQGRVVFRNLATDQQVRAGKALRLEHERLVPLDQAARTAMSQAIAEAAENEAATRASGIALPLPGGETGGLFATVLPLTCGERSNLCGAFAATAAIFVQDPIAVPPLPGEAFAKLYGLTGSELRVLLAMAPGVGVKEAAEVLGVGETTAKTHLQHIYDKTDTSKQTELMHLFMSSAPPVRAG